MKPEPLFKCHSLPLHRLGTAAICSLLALASSGLAESASSNSQPASAAAPATPTKSGANKTVQEIKNPVSWMNWGGDLRVRNEYFNDLLTLDPNNPLHRQDYLRFRGRLWTSVTPVDDFSVNARFTSEPREWLYPAGYSPYRGSSGWDWTEGIVDNLNVQWRNPFGLPAKITVGRQDIMLGQGWLVLEGTPNDGSWTIYFDAVRCTYELKEQHTTIDTIGIFQYAKDDEWLPTINNQDRFMGDQNEKGAILYVSNKTLPAANLDGYFIYKHDNRLSDPGGKYGDNADIYTLGGRVSGLFLDNWKYSAEGAYQFGEKEDPNIKVPASTGYRTLNAFGFNSHLSYLFKDSLNNELNCSFEFLSGDNPNSTGDEMFDLLWGRWPQWSEIGLYGYAAETRVGQEANLYRFGPGWSCTPTKKMSVSANYYALFSPEAVPTREASPTLFTGDGNFRGHFAQAVLKYKFNSHLSGHLWGECLFPGDYYEYHTPIPFLRAEMTLTF